ncbi:MAG: hypothetical protein Kow0081_0830 [Candidatus Dojkabacteria bacterium]
MVQKKKVRQKDKSETFVAVDIGTENIKTILFKVVDGQVEVIGYSRLKQALSAMNKAVIMDRELVYNAVDASIGMALSDAEKRFDNVSLPKEMIIGIAGELVSGVPIVVNVSRDDPNEEITENEIISIIRKVKDYTFDSAKDDIVKDLGISGDQLEEVETVVNSVKIDGIKTSNPVGLTAKELSYRVFSSFAPKIQIESIEYIAERLKLKLTHVPVEPYALARALPEMTFSAEGAIIIDIGAGTTDVVVAKEGDILGLAMFAIGGRSFTKRIEKEFKISHDEAEELKIQYSNGKLDNYREKEIKASLQNDIKAWIVGVELALAEIEEIEMFPRDIYICGGGSMLPDIKDILLENGWIQKLPFPKHPNVKFLYPNKVADVIDLTRSMIEPIDVTPLALTRTKVKR